jgi:hypothetical protein
MEQPKEKRTRQMTPELLEKLALARQKANEKRTENAKLKKMEKELKVKEQQTKAQEIKENYEKATTPEEPEEEPEPDPEPVQKPVKKKQTKKPKKPIVIVEESESDESEDEQVIYIKRSQTKKPAPQQQQPQVSAQEIRNNHAYNSLFNAPVRR